MPRPTVGSSFTERIARVLTTLTLSIIFLLGLVGLAVGYGLSNGQPLQAGIAFGVSSSLIAYVLTSGLHAWTSDMTHRRVLEELLSAKLRDIIIEVQSDAYGQVARQFPKLLPSSYFPPTNVSNPDFERDLTDSMLGSRNYYFRGVTARHVPVFLHRLHPSNLSVNILMLHPQATEHLALYVMDRFGNAAMETRDSRGLVERVQREMYCSIVGLYDVAHICPISIRLHRGPVFYRTEILDNRCFIAYYVGPRTTYAVTYAYDRGTFFYEAFYKDVLQLAQIDLPGMEFNAMTKEEDVGSFLASLGCEAPIEQLRSEFNDFKKGFNAQVR